MFRPRLALLLGLLLVLGHAPAWLHVSHCQRCVDRHWVNEASSDSTERYRNLSPVHAAVVPGCGHGCCGHSDIGVAEDRSDLAKLELCGGCHSDDSESSHHDSETCVVCQSLAAPIGFGTPILDVNDSEPAETDRATLADCAGPIFFRVLPPSRGPPQA